ncbi:MAG: type VI secretion system baseplate subunit TssK [Nannocystis sp.]|nr:type VI secretion system baseplate subunit TssK [Nannocystis sp.]
MTLAQATRPLWSEGMLVCPQHMQQQDLYHEQHLDARLRALDRAPWGVVSLAFDGVALKAGTLQLAAFRGVLPDGTPITFDANSSQRPPSRPIAGHFTAQGQSLGVYLALPLLREGIANCAPINAADDAAGAHRYRGVVRRVFDLTAARNEREVQVSEPALVLLFEGEARHDLAALKIGELIRDLGGGFALSDSYIPPCLALGAAPNLCAELQDVLSRAVTKRRKLTEERRAQSRAKIDLTTRELDKSLFLQALDSNLAWLRHCSDEPRTAPLAVYHALVQLAGALTTVSSEGDPEALPAFRYDALAETFTPLFAELRRLLSRDFDPTFIEVPLRPYQGNSWVGELRDERLLHCTTFVMVAEVEGDLVVASNEIPEITKIASWRRISAIVRLNSLGVPLRASFRPPAEVPIQPKQVYFLIDTADPLWEELVAERKIAIFMRPPYDPQRVKVRLLGIPSREG